MNQKAAFAEIRNFLAGRMMGATRDQALLEEVMKCLFAYKAMSQREAPTSPLKLAAAYRDALQGVHVPFAETDQLLLDPASIEFVHDRLSSLDVLNSDRDPVGDLYETFIGSAVRGADGQFFTPLNAIGWLTEAIDLKSGESVIDPACGAGGFLMAAARHSGNLDLYGIEKDAYLANLARARMQVLDLEHQVFCGNALTLKDEGGASLKHLRGEFDVVLANPPFGKNIRSVNSEDQAGFELGYRWKKGQAGLEKTSVLQPNVPPQVLFVERIMDLLRDGGRAGIVVPESILCGKSYAPVIQFIRANSAVQAVIGMPEALFKHSGKGGTHTKTCLLLFTKARTTSKIYMAEAAWCGHDSRGRTIDRDDLPTISSEYQAFKKGRTPTHQIGYVVEAKELTSNVLSPRYHEPTAQKVAGHLVATHDLISVSELLENGELQISSGNEVGKLAYGSGSVPFVRTSDISGWEIKADPKHLISEEYYDKLKVTQDVQPNDILMVRDGTYLIGTCAIISSHDTRIVYQSHILKIRCTDKSRISPYLLLAILSSEPVQHQIRSKTFTQDIINSLGNRLSEIILPVPRSAEVRAEIERVVQNVVADRVEARELARAARKLVVDPTFLSERSTPRVQNILQLA